jgi:hypothetical protein
MKKLYCKKCKKKTQHRHTVEGELRYYECTECWIYEKKQKKKNIMRNITIYIPEIYEKNIQKLIEKEIVASRSEAIRVAIGEYLHREYKNLELLGFFGDLS